MKTKIKCCGSWLKDYKDQLEKYNPVDAFIIADSSSILNDVDFHRRKLRGLRYVAARSIGFARCVHFAMYS